MSIDRDEAIRALARRGFFLAPAGPALDCRWAVCRWIGPGKAISVLVSDGGLGGDDVAIDDLLDRAVALWSAGAFFV